MKKLALLLSMALLAACGGGSSTSTTQSAPPPSDSGQLKMGKINVILAGDEAATQAKTLALGPLADANNPSNEMRIVISNPNITVNNTAFKNISTHVLPTAGISYTLPVAAGYKIEAISYRKTQVPGFNRLKRYGSADFDMTAAGPIPAVVITPTDINTTIAFSKYSTTELSSLAAYVTAAPTYKNKFNIAVTGRTAPLSTAWTYVQESADIPLRTSYSGTAVDSDLFQALSTPQSYSGGTLYALGEFYIDSFYLKPNETRANFTYVYPNRYWNDPSVSQAYGAAPMGSGGGFTVGGTW